MKIIVRESKVEDHEIKVRRIGRHIWVSTERPGVARSVERDIMAKLGGTKELETAIGFRIEVDDELA